MPDPLHIPLSEFQQRRLAHLDAELQTLRIRKEECVTTIVAGLYDPSTFATWHVDLRATEIVCTPPIETPLVAVE